MFRMLLPACAIIVIITLAAQPAAAEEDLQAQIRQLRQQIADLSSKLEQLEEKANSAAKSPPAVTTAYRDAKAKIDGRLFAGVFATGHSGQHRFWSTDVPNARLRFTFVPTDRLTFVARINADGARLNNFDYFYLDYDDVPAPGSLVRLGQRKIDFGQETWVDNPVENILISASVSRVTGYGIGAALRGQIGNWKMAPSYEIGFVNGPRGVTRRPSSGVPFSVKLDLPLPHDVFVSASYFTTGSLDGDDLSALSVAEVSDAPPGALEWERSLWELDVRYGYGPTGARGIIPSTDLPRTMLGATYGRFNDSADGAPGRGGDYWFIEGLYNFSPRFYGAARYSTVELDDNSFAELGNSPVAVNSYARTSIGLGYRLSWLADLKAEYTMNRTGGARPGPSLNAFSAGIAAKF